MHNHTAWVLGFCLVL